MNLARSNSGPESNMCFHSPYTRKDNKTLLLADDPLVGEYLYRTCIRTWLHRDLGDMSTRHSDRFWDHSGMYAHTMDEDTEPVLHDALVMSIPRPETEKANS